MSDIGRKVRSHGPRRRGLGGAATPDFRLLWVGEPISRLGGRGCTAAAAAHTAEQASPPRGALLLRAQRPTTVLAPVHTRLAMRIQAGRLPLIWSRVCRASVRVRRTSARSG